MVSDHMTCVVRVFDASGDIGVVDAVIVVTGRVHGKRVDRKSE